MIFKNDLGIYSTNTKFLVPAQTVADEADYSGVVGGGNGNWVLGSALKGHKAILVLATGAATSVTGITFGLGVGSDANGSGMAFVSGKTLEVTSNIGSSVNSLEVSLSGLDATKYYCPLAAVKGNGSATALLSVAALFPDPSHVA